MLPSQVYLQSLSAAVADAARDRGVTRSDDAPATPRRHSGFAATGVASSHVRVALVLDRLATPAVALERDARVEHERQCDGTSGTLSGGDTFSVTAGFDPNGGAK